MKKNNYLKIGILLACFTFCFSCKSSKNKESKDQEMHVQTIYFDSLTNLTNLSEIGFKRRFVQLETNEDCLIQRIKKIDFDEDNIFIFNAENNILVFDNQGNFKNPIGQIGQGPEEQLSIYDFYLDRFNKQVNLVDVFRKKIFKYSYSGKLMVVDSFELNIFDRTFGVNFSESGVLILRNGNQNSNTNSICIAKSDNYKIIKDTLPYIVTGEKYIIGSPISSIAQFKEDIYYTFFLSDTIYKYDNRSVEFKPHFVFNSGLKSFSAEDVKGEKLMFGMDAIPIARKKDRSTGPDNLLMTQNLLYFTYAKCKDAIPIYYHIIWNIDLNKGFILDNTAIIWPHRFSSQIKGASTNAFVSFYNYDSTSLNDKYIDDELKQFLLSEGADDNNPIVIFYEFE